MVTSGFQNFKFDTKVLKLEKSYKVVMYPPNINFFYQTENYKNRKSPSHETDTSARNRNKNFQNICPEVSKLWVNVELKGFDGTYCI
jgi:hypothetical protein